MLGEGLFADGPLLSPMLVDFLLLQSHWTTDVNDAILSTDEVTMRTIPNTQLRDYMS